MSMVMRLKEGRFWSTTFSSKIQVNTLSRLSSYIFVSPQVIVSVLFWWPNVFLCLGGLSMKWTVNSWRNSAFPSVWLTQQRCCDKLGSWKIIHGERIWHPVRRSCHPDGRRFSKHFEKRCSLRKTGVWSPLNRPVLTLLAHIWVFMLIYNFSNDVIQKRDPEFS